MTDGAQFTAEPRRRSDVDEYLETHRAVLRLLADGLDELNAQQELDEFVVADGGVGFDVVLDGIDHAERHHQTDRHQTDVDAQADELFDAVRFQRVPLPPLARSPRRSP